MNHSTHFKMPCIYRCAIFEDERGIFPSGTLVEWGTAIHQMSLKLFTRFTANCCKPHDWGKKNGMTAT